jgi:hypothetical protein
MFVSLSNKKYSKFVKITVAFLLIATCAQAQTDRGSIRGTIVDQTGAVVPGATITVSNAATGISNSVRSNDAGVYGVAALPSGSYRVEVAQTGFKTLIRNNVVVDVGNVTGLDLTLEVGNSTQTVVHTDDRATRHLFSG